MQQSSAILVRRTLFRFLFLISLTFIFSFSLLSQNFKKHKIQAKETVYSLAKQYNISIETLYHFNPQAKHSLRIGDILRIPVIKESKFEKTRHLIQAGETLYSIAKRYKTDIETLQSLNPNIDPTKIHIGDCLTLPNQEKEVLPELTDSVIPESNNPINFVEVAFILPKKKKGNSRYIQFYEGFLMGIYELKKHNISINLEVLEADTKEDIASFIRLKKFNKTQIIIGGHNEEIVNSLSFYSSHKSCIYVSPFIMQEEPIYNSKNIFRLNTPQRDLYPFLAAAFSSLFNQKNILFLQEDFGNHSSVTQTLQKELNRSKIPYEVIQLSQLQDSTFYSTIPNNTLIIPNESKENFMQKVFQAIDTIPNAYEKISFFGYPEWQAFSNSSKMLLKKYQTTIYSSFFFNKPMPESKRYLSRYSLWYSRRSHNGYPKYDVLGFDIARFFLRAIASYGTNFELFLEQIPSDGLQMDFVFKHLQENQHLTSVGLFFITYSLHKDPLCLQVVY